VSSLGHVNCSSEAVTPAGVAATCAVAPNAEILDNRWCALNYASTSVTATYQHTVSMLLRTMHHSQQVDRPDLT
jgi:hypothetical protein